MSYNALICKLFNVRKHSNADRLQVAQANGYSIVIGLDQKDEDLGVFFGPDGKLSEEMCRENNLFHHKEKTKTKLKPDSLEMMAE